MEQINWSKFAIVMEFLQQGGKVLLDGRVWCWLNNHVVDETEHFIFTIDGLAIEGLSYNSDTQEEKACYMGQKDLPFMSWVRLINDMPESQYQVICMNLKRAIELRNR